MAAEAPDAVYACVNLGEPDDLPTPPQRTIHLSADIAAVLHDLQN